MKKIARSILLLSAAAAFICAPGFSVTADGQDAVSGLKVDDIAPDFRLKNVDDRIVSLASYENVEGFIVVFTCNTCPFSVMYEGRLIDLHKTFAPNGWPVIAIQPNDPEFKPGDSFEEMKIRAAERAFPFVYLFDEGQKVVPQYGATRTPCVFLLDKNRKVRYIGAIDNNPQDRDAATRNYVADAIVAMKSGKEPDPNFTKTIGCAIKIR